VQLDVPDLESGLAFYRDSFVEWVGERGVLDRGADAFARFLHCRVGETDDRKARLSVGDIDLDIYKRTVETDDSARGDLGKHRRDSVERR
jgi:hypothetical protein